MAKQFLHTTSQHYWKIHKHIFNEELDRVSPDVRRAIQLQFSEPEMFLCVEHSTFMGRVNRRVNDVLNDEFHPYNSKDSFEADTLVERHVDLTAYPFTRNR